MGPFKNKHFSCGKLIYNKYTFSWYYKCCWSSLCCCFFWHCVKYAHNPCQQFTLEKHLAHSLIEKRSGPTQSKFGRRSCPFGCLPWACASPSWMSLSCKQSGTQKPLMVCRTTSGNQHLCWHSKDAASESSKDNFQTVVCLSSRFNESDCLPQQLPW